METLRKRIILKKNEERRLLRGHQWIFSNEIRTISGDPIAGDIVGIFRHDNKFLGIGFFHPHSLIACRFLSHEEEPIDFSFFEKRLCSALRLREKLFPSSTVYRLVHGEGDFLPGLIIDRYDDFFSLQTFSAGMDRRLTLIADVLTSLFSPHAIVERNESSARNLEQLPLRKGVLRGTLDQPIIQFDQIKFRIDLLEGQKTGFFLDQRLNRKAIQPYAAKSSVLDCFCNEGGFSLYAAHGGAVKVEGIDSSDYAIGKCRTNARLNSHEEIAFHTGDVFDMLTAHGKEQHRFGLVILDPPSFTKNKKTVSTALKGYKEINRLAIRLLHEGGTLATASCSHHISEEIFLNLVDNCVVTSGRKGRLIVSSGASPDHPTVVAMPETAYLKFAIFSLE